MVAGYVPEAKPMKVTLPPAAARLFVTPLTVTEYGGVPPSTITVTVPSLPPLQLAGVVVSDAVMVDAWPTGTPVAEPGQRFLSVMVAGYVPDARPIKVVLPPDVATA